MCSQCCNQRNGKDLNLSSASELSHSLIHHFETVPNSKKLQTTTEMWLLRILRNRLHRKHCGNRVPDHAKLCVKLNTYKMANPYVNSRTKITEKGLQAR